MCTWCRILIAAKMERFKGTEIFLLVSGDWLPLYFVKGLKIGKLDYFSAAAVFLIAVERARLGYGDDF